MLHPVIIIDYAMQRFFVLIFLLFLSISVRIPDNFCAAFPFPVLPVHSYGNDINYTHPYGRHSPLHYPENDRKKPLIVPSFRYIGHKSIGASRRKYFPPVIFSPVQ